MKEAGDVAQAQENVAAIREQLAELEAQFQRETQDMTAATDPLTERFEVIRIKPTKSNIAVKVVSLAWTPYWRHGDGRLLAAWE
jgi:TATA-binding protein-associated factor Taf7